MNVKIQAADPHEAERLRLLLSDLEETATKALARAELFMACITLLLSTHPKREALLRSIDGVVTGALEHDHTEPSKHQQYLAAAWLQILAVAGS